MWFKNLRIYKLTEPIQLDLQSFEKVLFDHAFAPCGSLDLVRCGFTPVIGEMFAHQVLGFTMICLKRQEKVLPPNAIAEQLEEKVRAIIAAESRSVGRKERQTLKDEILFSMLPKAFTMSTLDYAYIDHTKGYLIVNTPSARRAEDVCSKLREALGSLRAIPISSKNMPTQVMTHWVQTGNLAPHFELGEQIELEAGKDGRVVRCKRQDLTASEVLAHINSGMFVRKLAIDWRSGITFMIDETFAIKGIKFDDSIVEKSNERNPESKAEQFDADFAVMAPQIRALIEELLLAFGGEQCGI